MRRMRYLLSFCTAAACAALLYGLSVRFPNPLTQALSPVNASPWELGKLAFWPCLPAVLALRRLDGGSSLSGLCAAVLTATALAVGLGAAGLPPVPLCLLAVSHGLAAYALLLHRLRRGALYWYAALILLGLHPVYHPAAAFAAVHRPRRRVRHRPHPLLTPDAEGKGQDFTDLG